MDNAYRPPNAPVADPPPPAVKLPRRPWPITLASVTLVAAILDACVQLNRGDHFDVGFRAFWIGMMGFLALMIERRRNWARWVLMAIAVWNLLKLASWLIAPNTPEGVVFVVDYVALAHECAVELCLVAATVLVFLPGRAWFQREDS